MPSICTLILILIPEKFRTFPVCVRWLIFVVVVRWIKLIVFLSDHIPLIFPSLKDCVRMLIEMNCEMVNDFRKNFCFIRNQEFHSVVNEFQYE